MINRALAACTSDWIWLTDADCLVDINAAATLLSEIEEGDNHLFYGSRRHLSEAQTDALLAAVTAEEEARMLVLGRELAAVLGTKLPPA